MIVSTAVSTLCLCMATVWWKIVHGFRGYLQYSIEKDDLSSPEKLAQVYAGGVFLVATTDSKNDDAIVGMVAGQSGKQKGTFELRRMSVARAFRRQGVALQLLQALEEELKPARQIYLTCSSAQGPARRFYQRAGFACVKEFQFGSWFTKQGLSFFRYEKNY